MEMIDEPTANRIDTTTAFATLFILAMRCMPGISLAHPGAVSPAP
jgi:hypothetical protein